MSDDEAADHEAKADFQSLHGINRKQHDFIITNVVAQHGTGKVK